MTKTQKQTKREYITDVLIVGGGLGGVVAAEKLHQLRPDVKILIIEKGYFGYTGQSTKAGHGMVFLAPGDDIEAFCEEQVRQNPYGMYLNDQEALIDYQQDNYTYVQELEQMGGEFSHEIDGRLHHHHEFEGKKVSAVQVDIDVMTPYARQVLADGTRILERTYFTDFLTKDDKVIGAVGFNRDSGEFIVVRSKATILAGSEFNAAVRSLFYAPATALGAAYDIGAEFRNVTHILEYDLCYRNTGDFLYGVHWVVCNAKGENIFKKYNCYSLEELDWNFIRGCEEELRLGNGPLYADYSLLKNTGSGADGFYHGIEMQNRVKLDKFIREINNTDMGEKPEVSVQGRISTRSLRIDSDCKTTVKNLWGIGIMAIAGAAHGSWVHGDGVGNAAKTGLRAAKSIAKEIDDMVLEDVDPNQVAELKRKLDEPFEYKGKYLPYQIIHYLSREIHKPENTFNKTEGSIKKMQAELADFKKNLKDLIYVPEGNYHHLQKAIEAYRMIELLEMIFTVYEVRKESRGWHIRLDYPEMDNKNWLKWVIATKGEDGNPKIRLERIPMERYPWKPEGWDEFAQ